MTKMTIHVAGAGVRGGEREARARTLEEEHAALCGIVARLCDQMGINWTAYPGASDTQRRMAAARAYIERSSRQGVWTENKKET